MNFRCVGGWEGEGKLGCGGLWSEGRPAVVSVVIAGDVVTENAAAEVRASGATAFPAVTHKRLPVGLAAAVAWLSAPSPPQPTSPILSSS